MTKNTKAIIKQYIDHKKDNNEYPNYEDCIIWWEEKKQRKLKAEIMGELKGGLYLYSKQWLNNAISTTRRNSKSLVNLLQLLNTEYNQQAAYEDKEQLVIIQPTKIKLNND